MASIALFIGLINLSLKLMEVWIGINCFNISAGVVIFLVRVSGSRATWAVGPSRALGALLYLGLNLYFVCSVVALTRTVKRRKHLQKQILMAESTGKNLKNLATQKYTIFQFVMNAKLSQHRFCLALPRKQANQDDSNDTPQSIVCEFQVSFLLLRIRINQDKP